MMGLLGGGRGGGADAKAAARAPEVGTSAVAKELLPKIQAEKNIGCPKTVWVFFFYRVVPSNEKTDAEE